MELQQLRYFVAVVEAESISGASTALDAVPSTISQSLLALERDLGTPLFHRTPRGMVPTSAGHALLGPTRRILRDIRQVEAALSATPDRYAEQLDIAVLGPALNSPFSEALVAFLRNRPTTVVNVSELASEQDAVDVMASGAAEIVVTRLPLDVGRAGDAWATLPLGSYDVFVAWAPDVDDGSEAEAGDVSATQRVPGRPTELADLRDVPLVLMPSQPVLSASVEALMDENSAHLHRRAVVGSRETRTAWMIEGIAATLLGSRPAADVARHGAHLSPLRGASSLTVGLAWDPRTLSPLGRSFIDQVTATLGE